MCKVCDEEVQGLDRRTNSAAGAMQQCDGLQWAAFKHDVILWHLMLACRARLKQQNTREIKTQTCGSH
jgi:hypothetical protein